MEFTIQTRVDSRLNSSGQIAWHAKTTQPGSLRCGGRSPAEAIGNLIMRLAEKETPASPVLPIVIAKLEYNQWS